MKAANKIGVSLRMQTWLFIGGIVLLALLLFHSLLVPGQCLFTTDDNIGIMSSLKRNFPAQFWGVWADQALYGWPGERGQIAWTTIVLGLLPAAFGFNWIHAIDLVLASVFLFFFLRAGRICLPAIAVGILTAFWFGSNLTLTYAGHISKFGILMLAAAVLVCLRQIRQDVSDWFWCVLAGGLMGMMFIEQQDVALFFSMFLGLYAVFLLIREYFPQLVFRRPTDIAAGGHKTRGRIWRVVLLLAIIPAMALLVSSTMLVSRYTSQIKSVALDEDVGPQAKWEFATQWSWPPEESIDFVAPGYMGWRSGEPDGPYWGRMGRSAGWEQTGRGFMNFKLENQYLGAIPVIFAIFAFLAAVMRNGSRSFPPARPAGAQRDRADDAGNDWECARLEIFFWSFVAMATILLSFGKYFPLYALFYQLPVISDIRNPNKFLQVFQLAAGILAACGAQLVFRWDAVKKRAGQKDSGAP